MTATPRPEQHFSASLADVARAVSGTLNRSGEVRVNAVTSDSRDTPPDSLFFALAGEKFDGHAFVAKALDGGCVAAVVHENVSADAPIINVEDTLAALGALARWHRDKFQLPVVAITGSAGKSTTKEMTAAVLSSRFTVLKTTGNLNNRIGVPLTLFALGEKHTAAVIEAGISLPGEMTHLTHAIHPTVRVFLNAGLSHVEFLKDAAGVAHEKAMLFDGAEKEDVIVFNADDPLVAAEAAKRSGRKLSFGIESGMVTAIDIELRGLNGVRFTLKYQGAEQAVSVAAVGAHNIMNALAASAAGIASGLTLADVAVGLAQHYRPMKGRSLTITLAGERILIDDSYNSNPSSAKAALELLASLKQTRAIAVLGDMGELGDHGHAAHAELGKQAAALGVDVLLTCGKLAEQATRAALKSGIQHAKHFQNRDDVAHAAVLALHERDVVLVKGSRFMRMENVVDALSAGYPVT